MSSLENLKSRLQYEGGNQGQRMEMHKLRTLKKALLYSYQAETARLEDGREFRCLINPDNLKPDYDNKILSIPYRDICLNKPRVGKITEGEEETGIKPGDVFEWVEDNSFWIVYLRYPEETAYFRADIRKCESEVDINGKKYKVYVRGPVETTIQWNQKKGDEWNDINYSLIIYVTKNEDTLAFFHRFQKVEIDGNMWEVKTVDPYHGDGVIEVNLGEWYNNTIEKEIMQEPIEPEPEIDKNSVYIEGPREVSAFDMNCKYIIRNAGGGTWSIDSRKGLIRAQDPTSAVLDIVYGKSGSFNLSYTTEKGEKITLPIVIKSL